MPVLRRCTGVGGGHWFCDASAGALYQIAGSLWVSGCAFLTNRVTGGEGNIIGSGSNAGSAEGGALCTMGGTAILTHVTIAANSSSRGAGAGTSYLARGGGIDVSSGRVFLRNALLAANTADTGGNASGTLYDNGGNLSSDATGLFTAAGSRNNTDPQLLPLGAYGSPGLTMPLGPGSPALDAGNPVFCLPTDQRGLPRPQGAGCDIGAVEATVLSLQRLGDGNWRLFQTTLSNADRTLHTSTNLIDWSVLQTTNAAISGHVEFQVPDDGARARFFRTSGLP